MGVSGKWSEERDDVMLRCELMVVEQTFRFEMIFGERLAGESSAGIEIRRGRVERVWYVEVATRQSLDRQTELGRMNLLFELSRCINTGFQSIYPVEVCRVG